MSKSLVSNSGSGTVADKDISSLELELENLKLSKATLMREKEAKLQEIKTNVDTVLHSMVRFSKNIWMNEDLSELDSE
jgi:SMC interacting uncharacterized protein involved in chromosome segregation